jgi:hypothetical protein
MTIIVTKQTMRHSDAVIDAAVLALLHKRVQEGKDPCVAAVVSVRRSYPANCYMVRLPGGAIDFAWVDEAAA